MSTIRSAPPGPLDFSENITMYMEDEARGGTATSQTSPTTEHVLDQIHELQFQNEQYQSENTILRDETEAFRTEIANLRKAKEALITQVVTLQSSLDSSNKAVQDTKDSAELERERHAQEVADLKADNADVGRRLDERSKQALDDVAIKDELQSLRQYIDRLEAKQQDDKSTSAAAKLAFDKLQKERNMFARMLMHNWGTNEVGQRVRADGVVGAGYKYKFVDKNGGKEE